jgi:transposase
MFGLIMADIFGGLDKILARVGKRIVHTDVHGELITVEASSTVRAAPCPSCRSWSSRLHGNYVRHLQERPILEQRLVLAVQMNRFKCPNAACAQRTFAEDIGSLAGRHQRRTRSQARALLALGHALGGEPAARLAKALGLRTSADTLLRELRRSSSPERKPCPRVVGIDDWAIRRGHRYGTIVVDLERREPIAVFEGREATAVADWLRAHPTIEIVARDRAGAYSEAVETALPAAQQVADRWHLLTNLRDNVERMLQRFGPQMRQVAERVVVGDATLGRQGLPHGFRLSAWQRLSDDRRAQRLAQYEKVMALHAQGGTMKGIGRELAIDHRTVRKFVASGAFPERARRARGPTPLDAHRQYIEDRITQGCRCPRQIWREVRQRGHTGGRATVQSCVVRLLSPQCRSTQVTARPRTMPCPSARRAFGWLLGWRKLAVQEPKNDDHERFVQALRNVSMTLLHPKS